MRFPLVTTSYKPMPGIFEGDRERVGARRALPLHVSLIHRRDYLAGRVQIGNYVSFFKNGVNKSIGTGKIVVEFFSAATSTKVCRNLN